MTKIYTDNIYPPIQIRQFDWIAYRDPEGTIGNGPNEDAAILDLLENEGEEQFECDCGKKYEEAMSVLVCRNNKHGAEE